ncbi:MULTISPECIES: hypothetical protein [unclassified Fusibacter]|uniref:hypothetical protein n=1 Tax=unclassified Fusibacter TaxID=2624464 RepID=UPI001013AFB6|nr:MULTISPECIES: hypothetical protein [unclassified Fusibacter]MCK8060168.1 hypothetical protein [Fusibacter sp. A2]NPE22308.1 hypothetical protein [Fusibacter sp. A1]RXV61081.1 hypothetical protein DWB64_10715 [Fusibacter sp. A1]
MPQSAFHDFQVEQAKACFNLVWEYIDKEDRTEDDNINMIHAAHASRFLWGKVGEPVNLERGEWQVSKVYAILGMGEQALLHASACLKICELYTIKDWDIVFAYMAIAEAHKVLGNTSDYESFKKRATELVAGIKDPKDKEYTLNELDQL